MRGFVTFLRDCRAAAATEMALVLPFLVVLLFGVIELGNFFMDEHVLVKGVRDGARYASRLPLDENYSCDPDAATTDAANRIANVTRTGSVDGSATGRFPSTYWDRTCTGEAGTVNVSVRCVPVEDYPGVWAGRDGDIPVVSVNAAVRYSAVLSGLGFDLNQCLRAEAEMPAVGI